MRRVRPLPALPAALAAAAVVAPLLLGPVGPAAASTTAPTDGPTSTATSAPAPTPVPGAGRLDVAALQEVVDEAADDDVRLSVGVQSLGGATLTDGPVVLGSTESYSSASLIKVALVVAVLRAVDRGDLALDDTVEVTNSDDVPGTGVLAGYSSPYEATIGELCGLAITVSDNTASNVLAEEVGLEEVDRLVEDLGLEPTHMGRLFFSDGPKDESNDLDAASTLELLRAVHDDDVLAPASRGRLLGWMRQQELDTKIAEEVEDDVQTATKTGDTSRVSHAGGYLLDPGRETALVVLTETEDGRSPTAAADPYIQDVAALVAEQVLAAPEAPEPTTAPAPTTTPEQVVAEEVRQTLGGDDAAAAEDDGLPAAVTGALTVVGLLALVVVALRARVLLRQRARRR